MRALVGLVVFSILVPFVSFADREGPQTAFYRANALYAEGRFAEAVSVYEDLAASGHDGGALRFNLGNAYFKVGDNGRALLNYERAAGWIPEDPDLAANLDYVRSLTGAETCGAPLWARLLFPLAASVASWTLAVWATSLATIGLLLLGGAQWFDLRRRLLLGAAAACGVGWLVATSSLGYRVFAIERADRVVVVAEGESPVRFEPAGDGTTHFSVVAGTNLQRGESRPDWTQVARCDGRRGWIESAKVEGL